ncbi:MAG TPA: class I SAM-dependent methyltransferase [Gemmatimonadaceae bacterium]|nr:class I SAM-dependent methyltransferase [Gemmatimonadaceae bacterium]
MSLDTLAAGWIGQPFVAQRVTAAELRAQMLADLGTDRVDVLRCATCSMEHMSPMRTWSADHYPVQEHGFGFDHVTALQRLQGGSGKLLEIGCADGAFLDATSALGYRAIGLDFAPESVAAARAAGRDVRQSGVDHLVDAVAGDAPFDVIAMFQIIEHLEAPDETFSALGTLAHRDTRLLIGCPSPRRFARAYPHAERVGLSEFWDYPPQHTMRWTPAAMRRFLARHGWSVVHVAEEPFTLVGAAAFLTSSNGRHAGWYGHAWRRRATTAGWMLRLAATGAPLRFSGVRLYVEAARTASA